MPGNIRFLNYIYNYVCALTYTSNFYLRFSIHVQVYYLRKLALIVIAEINSLLS